jgi:hypothetical protein
MRYKVPQDVQQADKIVGPLTAIQLVQAVVGAAFAYFFYTKVALPVNILLVIITVGITIVVIFVRIHEMTFFKFVMSMILYLLRPRVRTWKKMSDTVLPQIRPQSDKSKKIVTEIKEDKPKQSIKELTALLDEQGGATELPGFGEEGSTDDSYGRPESLASIMNIDAKLRERQKSNENRGRKEDKKAKK